MMTRVLEARPTIIKTIECGNILYNRLKNQAFPIKYQEYLIKMMEYAYQIKESTVRVEFYSETEGAVWTHKTIAELFNWSMDALMMYYQLSHSARNMIRNELETLIMSAYLMHRASE